MDIWSKEKRSEVMSLIRSKNTRPEIIVRSLLHKMGLRFRLHRRDLPGCPDIVLPKYNAIIFVHGCFWHFHRNCINGKIPKTNKREWSDKLERNLQRDHLNLKLLKKLGWRTLILWECEIKKDIKKIQKKILNFLIEVKS